MPEADIPFIKYGDGKEPTMVVISDGKTRVRRIVRQTTRHVTVVSYTKTQSESRAHKSQHVTTVR